MRALLGYLVALLILLGGGYAALDWLVAPENRPAVTERSPRDAKNVLVKSAPTETAAVPEPSEADRKRNAGTTAEPSSTEQSDQASHKDADVRPRSSDAVEAAPSYNDGASRTSSNSKSNVDARQRKLGKRNQSARLKSVEAVLGNVQGTGRSREQRPIARSRRMAQPAEPDWYNALGLR